MFALVRACHGSMDLPHLFSYLVILVEDLSETRDLVVLFTSFVYFWNR